ncbi:MAG: translational GTPase TypA [bacterium]
MTVETEVKTNIRNVAVIAHVDHGKTTLIDHMLRQSGTFRKNQKVEDRVMDSLDLERERGITIASKNASFDYQGVKINLIDTPGHADFGGEVERIMNMVDGAILLVDASEGPLPQTRFVLEKAIEKGLSVIVCVNKIDRSDARISDVVDEVFELFMELGASDEQLDFPIVYSVAVAGYTVAEPEEKGEDLKLLFDEIINRIPAPQANKEGPLKMLVSNLGYCDFLGRLAIGRVRQGTLKSGAETVLIQENSTEKMRIQALFGYRGLEQVPVEQVEAGDIAVFAGYDKVKIGDTLSDPDDLRPLERIRVEQPTVGITIGVNNGPFSGQDGEHVTGSKLYKRLLREARNNVALKLENTSRSDQWKLMGRGELQLAILLEEMRREGYEMVVSKPQVLIKEIDGRPMEPVERVVIDVPEVYVGVVTEKLGARKGSMENYESIGSDRVRLEFIVPTRGLIGYRTQFLTDTRGTGLLNSYFLEYVPHKGEIEERHTGALIADRRGEARAYALDNLEDRGKLFINPGTLCYEGMIIGEHNKGTDLNVNVTKNKKLTNVRAAGSDDAIQLTTVQPLGIEEALESIEEDELIEITPNHIRLRCRRLARADRKR